MSEPENEIVGITLKLNSNGLHSKTCVFAEAKALPSLAHLHSQAFLEQVWSLLGTPDRPLAKAEEEPPLENRGVQGGTGELFQ